MHRKELLQKLIAQEPFNGNQAKFASAIGRSPSVVNQYLSGHRALGNGGARNIELKLNLPAGYFDNPYSHTETASLRLAGEPKQADNIKAIPQRRPPLIEELLKWAAATSDRGLHVLIAEAEELSRKYPAAQAKPAK